MCYPKRFANESTTRSKLLVKTLPVVFFERLIRGSVFELDQRS